jgi:replicative DNA helicase
VDLELSFLPHYTTPESMKVIVQSGLRSDLFFDENHRKMFEFSLDYYVRSHFEKVVTQDLLRDEFSYWFQKYEWPDEEYLILTLIDKIKERYRRVQIQEAVRSTSQLVMEDPEQALLQGLGEFARIQYETSTKNRTQVYTEGYDQRVAEYFDRVLQVQELVEPRGFFLGWPQVTEDTYGIKRSEIGVVVAFANMGKSWALSQIALQAAVDGTKVYFASLENSRELTQMRLDCLFTGIPYRAYERGRLDSEQVAALKRGREEIDKIKDNLIIDSPTKKTERTVQELYNRAKFADAELFVGDQLSWVTPVGNYWGDKQKTMEMTESIEMAADITKEMGMASVWACQFNRQSMYLHKGRGGLEHIGLTSAIEQIVDWAFSLSCTKEMRANESMIFEIIKSRRSELKAWLMKWALKDRTELRVRHVYND